MGGVVWCGVVWCGVVDSAKEEGIHTSWRVGELYRLTDSRGYSAITERVPPVSHKQALCMVYRTVLCGAVLCCAVLCCTVIASSKLSTASSLSPRM